MRVLDLDVIFHVIMHFTEYGIVGSQWICYFLYWQLDNMLSFINGSIAMVLVFETL